MLALTALAHMIAILVTPQECNAATHTTSATTVAPLTLEKLLAKISMPQSSSSTSSVDESVPKVSKSDRMEVEEELKPAARPAKATASNEQSMPVTSVDPVEQRRQQQWVARLKQLQETGFLMVK